MSPPNDSISRRTSADSTRHERNTTHERTTSFQDQSLDTIAENNVSRQPLGLPTISTVDQLPFPDTDYGADTDAYLDDIFNDPAFDPEWFNIDPSTFYGNSNNACGFIPDIPNIIDEVDRSDLMQTTETSVQNVPTPMSVLGSFTDM